MASRWATPDMWAIRATSHSQAVRDSCVSIASIRGGPTAMHVGKIRHRLPRVVTRAITRDMRTPRLPSSPHYMLISMWPSRTDAVGAGHFPRVLPTHRDRRGVARREQARALAGERTHHRE